MSGEMWKSYPNMNNVQYTMKMLHSYVSNTYTPYDTNYCYQNSSYMYPESQWSNYTASNQNISYQHLPVPNYGWQQNTPTEDWDIHFPTPQWHQPVNQGEQTHVTAPVTQVAASTQVTPTSQIGPTTQLAPITQTPTTQVTPITQTSFVTEVAPATQSPVSSAAATLTKNRPRARICFVNSSDGSYTPVIKRKRTRTAFTTSQIGILEQQFRKRPYVSPEERRVLTSKLQVSDKVIKVWFQNRRLKEKREREESISSQSPVESPDSMENNPNCNMNLPETTFVDNTLNELLDTFEQIIYDETKISGDVTVEEKSFKIYEPISPPDFSQEIGSTFAPVDPVLAFQNILDCANKL